MSRRLAMPRAVLLVVMLLVAGITLVVATLALVGDSSTVAPDDRRPSGGEPDDGSVGSTPEAESPDPRPDSEAPGADTRGPDGPGGAEDPGAPRSGEEHRSSGIPADRPRLVIHHVGDVNLDPSYLPVLRQQGAAAVWEGAHETFSGADLVMVNLECAAAEGGTPQPKQFLFRCDLDALPAMREAGVDVVTLANNHSGDFGIDAMVASRSNVEAAGIEAVGVGGDEADAYAPRIVEVAGWRVAILGFGGVVPVPEWTARGDRPGQATGYDPERMAEAVTAASADADLVLVSVHWGEEGSLTPRPDDRVKADAMIEAGASVVFGHHAHRLQPLEIVHDVPVFWNLGNFVWPRHSLAGAATAVAEYVVEPDGTVTACLIPFELDEAGIPRPTGEPRDCR